MVKVERSVSGQNVIPTEDSKTIESPIRINYKERIHLLFQNHHRLTDARFRWVWMWVGANESDTIMDQTRENRLQFLSASWDNYEEFRPFDTVESSEEYLRNNLDKGFIIRLSTSQPGKITVTRRAQGNIITHTRFTVLNNGGLVDGRGNQFDSIHHLCGKVSKLLKEQSLPRAQAEYR